MKSLSNQDIFYIKYFANKHQCKQNAKEAKAKHHKKSNAKTIKKIPSRECPGHPFWPPEMCFLPQNKYAKKALK